MTNNPQHSINSHRQLIHILQPQPSHNLSIILTSKRLRINTREMRIILQRVLKSSFLINKITWSVYRFRQNNVDLLELVAGGFGQNVGELELVVPHVEVFELLADPALLADDDGLNADGLEGVGDGDEEALLYCVLLLQDEFLALILQVQRFYLNLQDIRLILVDLVNRQFMNHDEYLPNWIEHSLELLVYR